MTAKPLTREELATLRKEAEAEQDAPGKHGEWERLVLRLLATLDAARVAAPSDDERVSYWRSLYETCLDTTTRMARVAAPSDGLREAVEAYVASLTARRAALAATEQPKTPA
jgi:hypothetical protein